jgi:threonine/homoserine/homoserine lactone efflux protein
VSTGFLLTSLIVVATPGTGVLYTLSAGLARGRRASVVAAFGCTLGIIPHMAAAIMGLAALLYASSVAFQTLKYVGAAYLLYLAFRTLRERGALDVGAEETRRSSAQVIFSAVAINLLNPKLSIFFFAFLPQFVSSDDAHRVVHMAVLSGVFMVLTFAVFVGYGLGAATVRRQVLLRPRVLAWMRRSFAAAFAALGVRVALADR